MKYLLKNGTVVTGEKSEQLDILVEGEKIVQVGKNLPCRGGTGNRRQWENFFFRVS